jgi:hypothetical protein
VTAIPDSVADDVEPLFVDVFNAFLKEKGTREGILNVYYMYIYIYMYVCVLVSVCVCVCECIYYLYVHVAPLC